LSADLADRLKNSSAEKRQQAVLAACCQAVEHSALTDPTASSVLSRLKAGGEIDDLARLRLDRLVDAWDEEAWKEVDNTHTGDLSVYAARFNKARAANALVYALEHRSFSQDSWLAAAEAIYEALVCLDDDPKGDELTQVINEILS
jgi:precorrin-4 methylase